MSSSLSRNWRSDRATQALTRAAVAAPAWGVRRAALAVFRGSALQRSESADRAPGTRQTARPLIAPLPATALLAATLAVISGGCREEFSGPTENVPPRIAFPLNTLYRFNVWQLDEYGGRIQGSERGRRWTVLSTDASRLGYDDVTLVGDSGAEGPRTVSFRFTQEGDIYQYGYLADLVQKLEGRTIAPRWDLIAAFSKGWGASWTVGILDSAGSELMTGSSSEEVLYFTVTVNGLSTIAAAYPVVLSSRSMESVLWVSENPPAFMRLREERYPLLTGRPGALLEATTVVRP